MCSRGLSSQGRVWRPAAGVDTCPTSTSAYDFQDQFPVIGPLRRNAEGVLDHPGRFFHAIFLRELRPTRHGPRLHFFADFHFEDHTNRRIDRVFLAVAAGPNQIGSEANIPRVDDTYITATGRQIGRAAWRE